jgi:cytochrome P450
VNETEDVAAQGLSAIFDNPVLAADPFPFFKVLRDTAPVFKPGSAVAGPASMWIVTRYDDVLRILRDPGTFSSVVTPPPAAGEPRRPTILFDDPPMHTRMRGLLSSAFTPRMIELQRDLVEENCRRMIDDMLKFEKPDLIAGLAYPLPVMVIANMLGVQDGDMATFKRWSDAIIENIGNVLASAGGDALVEINAEFDAYFKQHIIRLRERPEDNLLSALIHAESEEDGKLSMEDLLVVCRVLLVAGNETTTGLIVNTARVFSKFPHVVPLLKQRPELIPSAIEEVLRMYPPFFAAFRRAAVDVEIEGVKIPADDRVLVMIASANHDERVFTDPETFIADREPNRHLGFGMGIHYCLGAPLARMEGQIAMRLLLERINGLHIEPEDFGTVLRPGGPAMLPVRFDRDPAFALA